MIAAKELIELPLRAGDIIFQRLVLGILAARFARLIFPRLDRHFQALEFRSDRLFARFGCSFVLLLNDFKQPLEPTDLCLDRLGWYARQGVDEFILGAGSLPFSVYDWSMVELFADAVLPAARSL